MKHAFLSCSAYGTLTVRSLLDMREHMMNESEFDDPYLLRKQEENEAALKGLASRLKYLDALEFQDRQARLIEGILAGNVFDWGAKEVAACLRQGNFHFDDAHQSLQSMCNLFPLQAVSLWIISTGKRFSPIAQFEQGATCQQLINMRTAFHIHVHKRHNTCIR